MIARLILAACALWMALCLPAEARTDIHIMSDLHLRLRQMYTKDGGKFPDPITKLWWPYVQAEEPTPEEVAKEYVTKVEVHSDINRVLDRLDRLENKIDVFIREQKSALG